MSRRAGYNHLLRQETKANRRGGLADGVEGGGLQDGADRRGGLATVDSFDQSCFSSVLLRAAGELLKMPASQS